MPAIATADLQKLLLATIAAQSVAQDIIPIVPSDTTDLEAPARGIRCTGEGGALRITTAAGNVRDTLIAAGEILYVEATRIHAAGTVATGLEALA